MLVVDPSAAAAATAFTDVFVCFYEIPATAAAHKYKTNNYDKSYTYFILFFFEYFMNMYYMAIKKKSIRS